MKQNLLAFTTAAALFVAGAASANPLIVTSSGSLNMRQGPGTGFGVVTQIQRGAQVDVIEQNGSWSKVRTANGQTGWVATNYLGSGGAAGNARPQMQQGHGQPSPQQQVNTHQPSQQPRSAQPQQAQAQPQRQTQGMGNTGTSQTRHVRADVGNLNMRSGPGTNHAVQRSVPSGTGVTVLETNGDWVRVQLSDGVIGWVMQSFLGA